MVSMHRCVVRPYSRHSVLHYLRRCCTSSCSHNAWVSQKQQCSTQASSLEPLSILSWSVDGSLHSHHRCRRRFTLEERLPHLVTCVRECEPDVVALQDSTPEVRHALSGDLESSADTLSKTNTSIGSSASMLYTCLGAVRNGRCGEVQLFLRRTSKWTAVPLQRGAGVSAELRYPVAGPSRPAIKAVITNVDLSYRGKSLGQNGELLASPQDSLDGSPFAFSQQNRRAPGQIDPFRFLALQYISKVNRPDILVGNFYMSRSEHLPGYKDAWVLSGSPPQDERTTNTFQCHRLDQQTNYYYFVPSPTGQVRGGSESWKEECRGTRVPFSKVGVSLPLTATLARQPGSDASNTHEKKAMKDGFEWALPPVEKEEPPLSGSLKEEEEGVTDDCEKGRSSDRTELSRDGAGGETHSHEMWVAQVLRHPHQRETVSVPEVAGRYQRCFVRHPVHPHQQRLPVYKHFGGIRVLVPRPFTLKGVLCPLEAGWHSSRKGMKNKKFKEDGEQQLGETPVGACGNTETEPVLCAPSDQYPLLVHFTPQ